MKELLLTVAKGLVEFPDQVTVEVDEPNEESLVNKVVLQKQSVP